jgi:hypothetical protein
LHEVLELAHAAKPVEVFKMLVHVCRLGKQRAATQITATVDTETTYRRVVDFVEQFLQESDGGTRLASVTGAFVALLNEGFTVRVYPPNYADQFAKTTGDVEIVDQKTVISAYECKHRPITIDDIKHGIKKAKAHGVAEYNFVGAVGLAPKQDDEIRQEIQTGGSALDLHLFDIHDVAPHWAAALNPVRRKRFGDAVVKILRDNMKRSEVANQAAELWNSLEE